MNTVVVFLQFGYGVLLIAAGLNGLFFKKGKPVLSLEASMAHKGLESARFVFPVAYTSLVIGGGLICCQLAVPFALILVSPTVVSIYLFNIVLQKNFISPGLLFCGLNIAFAFLHQSAFSLLF